MIKEETLQADAQPVEAPVEAPAKSAVVTTESIVEALLIATDTPVPPSKMAQIIGGGVTPGKIKECIAQLNERYEQTGASFRIEEIAKGFQILTLPEYNIWLRKLLKVRSETKLSQAALETLAVVAYKQPVMRAIIEEIRGVAGGEVLQRLREMNLVKIVGRAEELGRPLLYGTTKRFLEIFGLGSLEQLPMVEELVPPEKQKKAAPPSPEPQPLSDRTIDENADGTADDDADDPFARIAAEARATQSRKNNEATVFEDDEAIDVEGVDVDADDVESGLNDDAQIKELE